MSFDLSALEARVKHLEQEIQNSILNHNILTGMLLEAKKILSDASVVGDAVAAVAPEIAPAAAAIDVVSHIVDEIAPVEDGVTAPV